MSRHALSLLDRPRRFRGIGGVMQSAMNSGVAFTASLDEAALVARLRAGDDRAFEDLVRTYGSRLLPGGRRFVRHPDDAQDVVQSAYLSAFRALEHFEGNCQLSTWLHRIVVNTALMRLRSRKRKPEEWIEDILPPFQEDGQQV